MNKKIYNITICILCVVSIAFAIIDFRSIISHIRSLLFGLFYVPCYVYNIPLILVFVNTKIRVFPKTFLRLIFGELCTIMIKSKEGK